MADDWKKESAPEHLEVIQANTIEIALKSAAVSTVEGKKSEIEKAREESAACATNVLPQKKKQSCASDYNYHVPV